MTERLSVKIFDENYKNILNRISFAAKESGRNIEDIILLAATKTQDIETVNHAIESGISYIGENRVQEFSEKKDFYAPVNRHFIGHLQSNKAKYIVGEVSLIHSVDSVNLASVINSVAAKKSVKQDILLEVNIGKEQSKSGFLPEEVLNAAEEIAKMSSICIKGLMAIPPVMAEKGGNIKYFNQMYKMFIDIKEKNIDNVNMEILSMGMSDDFEDAIKCGANLVRIGTALFGERNYK